MNAGKTHQTKLRGGLLFAVFTGPALLFVLFATDIPFLMNLYYSVFDWNGISSTMKYVGLNNFVKVLTADKMFIKAALFTLRYALYYVVIVNVISLAVAVSLAKPRRINTLGRAFYYVPYIISLTALSLIWKFIFGPAFESMLSIVGWEFFGWSWVGTPNLAFYVVVIMTIWQNVGFYMVTYIAGLMAVPTDVLEAATIDGVTRFQMFGKVTLPLIMPALSICTLTSLTFAFKLFDVIMVFTKGGPANSTVSVAYNIYKEAFVSNKYGIATAKSLIFFVAVLVVTVLQVKVTKSREVES
jgi:raffinose/stachyose/melibiose transport system permease protein